MSLILTKIWGWTRYIFAPEMQERRKLREGFTRENLLLWAVVTAVVAVVFFLLPGTTFTLYLPHKAGWDWVEVPIQRLPAWVWWGLFLFATGLCLYPRFTAATVAVFFSLYYFYAAANGSPVRIWGRDLLFRFPELDFYAFHYFLPLFVFFTALLTFIYFPARKGSPQDRPSAFDVLLCLATLVTTFEFIWNFVERGDRAGLVLWRDVVFGTVMTVISIEMCRRVLGWVLPLLGVFFFIYSVFGFIFPGGLSHKGFPYNEVISFLYGIEGIYGTIANVYATYVFLFILFGVLLERTKVGDVFVDLAFALVGRLKGGAAKSAVVSSGLVGSIVGSGAANIVITGTFTIPLMKRSGYMPHYAAAVEAVSSIGGHLMPPVMGSAAFLLAAFTETKYVYVALISFVPALMYYFSVYLSVHYRACLRGIEGLPKEELPQLKALMKKDGYLLLPVLLLIVMLVVGFSPFYAAFWSILVALALGCFRDETRLVQLPALAAEWLGWGGPPAGKEGEAPPQGFLARHGSLLFGLSLLVALPFLDFSIGHTIFWAAGAVLLFSSPRLVSAFVQGAINSLTIGATAGIMGVVLAGVTMPGLALKFSAIVLEYAGGSLPVAILLCAIASYILGMGMTITASYVLLSILAVPALVELGVPVLAAHLIILWLSQDASLTPPFALGAFIAAGIAGADPMRTGFTSLKLAKPLYIIPFLMAYSPILMDPGSAWGDVIITWISGFMGFFCSAAALEGFLRRKLLLWERGLLVAAAFLLFFNVGWMKLAGAAFMGMGIALQYFHRPPKEAPVRFQPAK